MEKRQSLKRKVSLLVAIGISVVVVLLTSVSAYLSRRNAMNDARELALEKASSYAKQAGCLDVGSCS